MAFLEQKREKIAQKFGISKQELMRAAGRVRGFVKKHGDSVGIFADSFQFLIDTIEEHQAKIEKKEFAHHLRNVKHKKYEIEIVKLFHSGLGAKRISDTIFERHRVKIPKTTIEYFLSKNGIRRVQNG